MAKSFALPPTPAAPVPISRRPDAVLPRELLLLGALLIIKLVVLFQLARHPLLQPHGGLDAEYYVKLAQQVARGDWKLGAEPFFLSPLYIYFLGLVLAVSGGSLAAVRVAQVLLGTAAVWLVYRTARQWADERVAIVAAILAATTGLFTFHEILTIQAALDPFLTALGLWLVSRAVASPRWPRLVAAGGGVGLFALNRPNVLPYALVVVVLLAVRAPVRRGLAHAAWFMLGLAVAIAPATVRNAVASGDFVLISSHGGLNFYIGNNAGADGTYRAVQGVRPSIVGQAEDARLVAEAALGHPVKNSEVSSFFFARSRDWITSEPRQALALFARKLAYTFNATDLALNYSYAYYSRDESTWLAWLVTGPWCLLPLGLFGIAVATVGLGGTKGAWRASTKGDGNTGCHPADGWYIWAAFVPVYGLSVALFFVSGRYRLPLLVPLCVTGAVAPVWLFDAVRARRLQALAVGITAIGVLALMTNWPLGLNDGRSHEREEMILYLIDNRLDAEATVRLARSDATDPDRGRLLLHVGQAFLDRGETGSALPYLRSAVDAGERTDVAVLTLIRTLIGTEQVGEAAERIARLSLPPGTDPATLLAVGDMAFRVGRPELALRFLDRALTQAPQMAALHEKRGLALAMLDRGAEATAELEEAHRLDPGRASACLNLAVLQAQQGRIEAARASAREAVRLQPDYPQAHALLETLGPSR